jgi:hypothetical protein
MVASVCLAKLRKDGSSEVPMLSWEVRMRSNWFGTSESINYSPHSRVSHLNIVQGENKIHNTSRDLPGVAFASIVTSVVVTREFRNVFLE